MFRNNILQFRIFSITVVRTSNLAFYTSNGRLVSNESGFLKDYKSRRPNISAPEHHPNSSGTRMTSPAPQTSAMQHFETSGTRWSAAQHIF